MNDRVGIETLEDTLLDFFLKHPEKSYRHQDILSALGFENENSSTVKRALRRLVNRNAIMNLKGKRYAAVSRFSGKHIRSGTFEALRFSSGFVRTDNGDIYVPSGYSGTALPGDLVNVEILAPYRRGSQRSLSQNKSNPEGRIIDVLKRKNREFAGEFAKGTGGGFVFPDSEFLKRQIFIPEQKMRKARTGQKVMVKIVSWNNEYANPLGEIVEIIGLPGEKGTDVLAVALAAGIPKRFPDKVLQEAGSLIPLGMTGLLEHNRRDFRDELIFTIDPEDAKDFDDAISLTRQRDGNYLLGVYIADVTAYVQEGSRIDKEAAKRGTSVYLIDKVIPMLPEGLSEDLCSLKPHEDRLVYCIRMTCSPEGEVVDYEIVEGVINSRQRFNYEEAHAIIERKTKNPHGDTLREMNRFAKILRKKRFKAGGMDFYVPEVVFDLDDNGVPSAISLKPILETHSLIEEFMLLANQTAARHKAALERKYLMSLPFLYRVHEEPDEESVRKFAELARSLGYADNKGKFGSSLWFQNILKYFNGRYEKVLIEEIALRSMMKALYQPKNIGHFGLGFKEYTHFTSPIRRYPDLVVHRLLKKYTAGIDAVEATSLRRKVGHIGKHSSAMEQRALNAERDVITMKQLEYMQKKIGEVYKGVISGVTSFGIFVELEDILVGGLVHVRDLGGDFYVYEEGRYRLVGEHTGRMFKIGDKVTVQVIKVNVERRHLDLMLVEDEMGSDTREQVKHPENSKKKTNHQVRNSKKTPQCGGCQKKIRVTTS